jgi:predicted amidohydrolase
MELILHAWTFDVGAGAAAASPEAYAELFATRVEQSYAEGADIVMFPEYAWAALPGSLDQVASTVWDHCVPALHRRLAHPGKLAVLGTAPCHTPHGLRNRAIIFRDGDALHQDKLHLTPWESAFIRGDAFHLIEFNGLTLAVIICLDIEVPELSTSLRGAGVDLILVPSATESVLGVERVTRCASARAVELCCPVVVSALVGQCESELIDANVGRVACYLPSQAAYQGAPRCIEGEIMDAGFAVMKFKLDLKPQTGAKQHSFETNPALLQDVKEWIPVRL